MTGGGTLAHRASDPRTTSRARIVHGSALRERILLEPKRPARAPRGGRLGAAVAAGVVALVAVLMTVAPLVETLPSRTPRPPSNSRSRDCGLRKAFGHRRRPDHRPARLGRKHHPLEQATSRCRQRAIAKGEAGSLFLVVDGMMYGVEEGAWVELGPPESVGPDSRDDAGGVSCRRSPGCGRPDVGADHGRYDRPEHERAGRWLPVYSGSAQAGPIAGGVLQGRRAHSRAAVRVRSARRSFSSRGPPRHGRDRRPGRRRPADQRLLGHVAVRGRLPAGSATPRPRLPPTTSPSQVISRLTDSRRNDVASTAKVVWPGGGGGVGGPAVTQRGALDVGGWLSLPSCSWLRGRCSSWTGCVEIRTQDTAVDALFWNNNLEAWGWFILLVGIGLFVPASLIFRRTPWAYVTGIVVSCIGAIINFFWIISYPLASVVLITLSMVVVYALTTYGTDDMDY